MAKFNPKEFSPSAPDPWSENLMGIGIIIFVLITGATAVALAMDGAIFIAALPAFICAILCFLSWSFLSSFRNEK